MLSISWVWLQWGWRGSYQHVALETHLHNTYLCLQTQNWRTETSKLQSLSSLRLRKFYRSRSFCRHWRVSNCMGCAWVPSEWDLDRFQGQISLVRIRMVSTIRSNWSGVPQSWRWDNRELWKCTSQSWCLSRGRITYCREQVAWSAVLPSRLDSGSSAQKGSQMSLIASIILL